MPDTRRHRGPHPEDVRRFAPEAWPRLQAAVADLSWLLSRRYAPRAALQLVGDHYALDARQRLAVMRSSCSDQALQNRLARRLEPSDLAQAPSCGIHIDGFNLVTTVEAALGGGILLRGRDKCYRDMSSMHGSYRKVSETAPALNLIGDELTQITTAPVVWWLDRPVSNSGRLRALLSDIAQQKQWPWRVELVDSPDRVLAATGGLVVSADSVILDRCRNWLNLAAELVRRRVPQAQVVPMDGEAESAASSLLR